MSSNVIEGFVLTMASKMYIIETTGVKRTNTLAKQFVDAVCDDLKLSEETRERYKTDTEGLKVIKNRMDRAFIEKVDTGKIVYYRITGKNFMQSVPEAESDCLVFVGRSKL